ncbi:MAG: hypothetical protein DRP72_00845 [Candidatus Omnitrophota bacterium]|nr:MAG: hypothetical protein DRP72_00845 [Candidatus Omnitrophota bacterium]
MKLPQGFLTSGIRCGIKYKGMDLGLIECREGAIAEGFFTQNTNLSYSVMVSKKYINNPIKAVIVTSGNANCFTKKVDFYKTLRVCKSLASYLRVKQENILIASTGIIGKSMPFSKIINSIPMLCNNLSRDWRPFAQSILTTDTFTKTSYQRLSLKEGEVTIFGFAKGAGMINPQLATMLAFILTDAKISSRKILRKLTSRAVDRSFNSISVDGCMSTNDTVFFLSYSRGILLERNASLNRFGIALDEVCQNLAKMIVKDAEGSTKFVQLDLEGAKSEEEAKVAFKAIANSLLLKSAIYGESPNWGRIISSLGEAKIKVKEEKFKVRMQFKGKDVKISVDLGRGRFRWRGWFSDITPIYVKMNASYS